MELGPAKRRSLTYVSGMDGYQALGDLRASFQYCCADFWPGPTDGKN
jgi:hypothetical protein